MERSAFPQQGMAVGGELLDRQFGLTLREYVFALALQGLLANPALVSDAKSAESAVVLAWGLAEQADVLIEADAKTQQRKTELGQLAPTP